MLENHRMTAVPAFVFLAVSAGVGVAQAEVVVAWPRCDMPAEFFAEAERSILAVAAESGSEAGAPSSFRVECASVDEGLRLAVSLVSGERTLAAETRVVSRASALAQLRAMTRSLVEGAQPSKNRPTIDSTRPVPPASLQKTVKIAPKKPLDLHVKLSASPGSGYPDMFGPNLGLSMPNRFEMEVGVAWGIFNWTTYYVRAGFPWRVAWRKELGWNFLVIPKIGYRYTESEEFDWMGCGSGCEGSHGGGGETHGLNAVLSFEPVYMFFRHFGLFVQLTAGVTAILGGYHVTIYDGDSAKPSEKTPAGGVEGDFKLALGFVF